MDVLRRTQKVEGQAFVVHLHVILLSPILKAVEIPFKLLNIRWATLDQRIFQVIFIMAGPVAQRVPFRRRGEIGLDARDVCSMPLPLPAAPMPAPASRRTMTGARSCAA